SLGFAFWGPFAGPSPQRLDPPLGPGERAARLVSPRTGNTYALKAIARSRIQEHSVHLCVEREVDCHSRMDHPNIVKLFQHFEDSDSIYLLLEFATGGQLYAHMRQRGVLPDLEAAGYFSDVVHALIYDMLDLSRHGR
ncbi:unnamed protein product, partial [Prorocentrum cordatum]